MNSAITLIPDSEFQDNRRMVFSLETFRFSMELAMERTEFIAMK